jgi:hypothetical protein
MKYMPSQMFRIPVLALCLVILFIAAQFHFCADANSQATSSHLCPLCASAGLATIPPLPGIALTPSAGRLANFRSSGGVAAPQSRPLSLRAPPARDLL